jgi:hypothetical protein
MSGYDFCPIRFEGETPVHQEALCGRGAGVRVALEQDPMLTGSFY